MQISSITESVWITMSTAVHRKDKAFPWGKKKPTRCGKIGKKAFLHRLKSSLLSRRWFSKALLYFPSLDMAYLTIFQCARNLSLDRLGTCIWLFASSGWGGTESTGRSGARRSGTFMALKNQIVFCLHTDVIYPLLVFTQLVCWFWRFNLPLLVLRFLSPSRTGWELSET